MKKIILICLAAMLLTPISAMSASWTAEQVIDPAGTELISTLSNNVTLVAFAAVDDYAAATGHSSGSKVYASTSGDTKIYQQTDDPPVPGDALTTSDTAQFSATGSGWDSM